MILRKFVVPMLLSLTMICITPLSDVNSDTFYTSTAVKASESCTNYCVKKIVVCPGDIIKDTGSCPSSSDKNAVSLNKKNVNLFVGNSVKLKLNGATESVKWKSTDKSIAKVNKNGKVTAVSAGVAKIKAISAGKTYKCKVTVSNANTSDSNQIYDSMIAYKKKYPEGTPWTNSNYYKWNGGIYTGGYGCAGFAFMLSDAAFGTKKARVIYDLSNIENTIRVGDIIRVNNDSHSVIVLKVKSDCVQVAEGNYNSSVHWGREISYNEIKSNGTYYLTRYDS